MAALTDLDDLINRLTGGSSGTPEQIMWRKDQRITGAAPTTLVAGRFSSLWGYTGVPCVHGTTPGAAAIPDNTTDGALKQSNPGGGRQKWLLGGYGSGVANGTLILYDRLLHVGGLSGTTTGAQTVGGTLTRYTNGIGNQIWVEIYSTIGGTATLISASFTDQDGNSGLSTSLAQIGGTGLNEAQRILPIALGASAYGVQAVASVTLTASTLTAGNFGVTIAHPLLMIPVQSQGISTMRDLIAGLPSIQEILTDACLAWAFLANATTVPGHFGMINSIEA